jgi:hypothetical protein
MRVSGHAFDRELADVQVLDIEERVVGHRDDGRGHGKRSGSTRADQNAPIRWVDASPARPASPWAVRHKTHAVMTGATRPAYTIISTMAIAGGVHFLAEDRRSNYALARSRRTAP